MLAIVCPGQGAQKPGFLAPWLERSGVAARLEELSAAAGIDLIEHGTQSDADTIRDTAVAQPLLVAAGIIADEALRETVDPAEGAPIADMVAGHSVGEITASAITGILSPADAMRLVSVRANAMARAAAAEETSMAAVVGGVEEEVLTAIAEHGLVPANLNAKGQIVAAGAAESIRALAAEPPARARVMPLQVAGAFHTPYMEPARDELAAFVPELSPSDPSVDVFSNADGRKVGTGAEYLDLIVTQVASPVDWVACMESFRAAGITAMIELAPAGTLTGIAKRELKDVERVNLNTPEDLEAAAALVADHLGSRKED